MNQTGSVGWCSACILMKIPVFPLPQSRTPALVFEHVNNTDFKVGAKRFLRLLSSWCGNLLSWHTRCLPVLECVCDGGIWTVQCYVFGARKSAIFWFYPQSLAHSLTVYGSNLVLSLTVGMFINLFWVFLQQLYQTLTDYDIRFYMYEILKVSFFYDSAA